MGSDLIGLKLRKEAASRDTNSGEVSVGCGVGSPGREGVKEERGGGCPEVWGSWKPYEARQGHYVHFTSEETEPQKGDLV